MVIHSPDFGCTYPHMFGILDPDYPLANPHELGIFPRVLAVNVKSYHHYAGLLTSPDTRECIVVDGKYLERTMDLAKEKLV